MRATTNVLLAWARDRAGAKVHVARLDAASRRARAPFACLGCGEPLVARLGKVRARHFAHRPGSTCPLTAPESALHLDAKERLVALCRDAFAGTRAVALVVRCPSCRRPSTRDLAGWGDAAVEEGAVGALRADVLVLSGGAPALALEVAVTHAIEPEKEAALSAAGVPAVEIDACAEWEREVPGGVEIVASRALGLSRCAACDARARADGD
ncbi:MAG TPA: competence protein CoiA family protein, partial [Anaeromyxobacter sp.]